MFMDKLATFADALAVDGGVGSVALGDTYDLGAQPQQLGTEHTGLFLNVLVTTAIAGATVQVKLMSDAQDPIVPASASEHVILPAIAAGTAAGFKQSVRLPVGIGATEYERLLGIAITRGGTVSAGAISAFLTLDTPAWKSYADAQN